MARILVTGAGGQVGLELLRHLHARGDEVHATDVAARPKGVPEDITWNHLDVTDADAVLTCMQGLQPDVVYHLAAILSAAGERRPLLTYQVNQTGTYNVLEAARQTGSSGRNPRVLFASTIAAFGPGLPDPVPNEVSMRPTTMYGVTKVAGELLGEYYHRKWGVDFRGVRFPGLINAGLPGGGTSDYALFMYVDGVRVGHYESFCRPDTRIPMMYMSDAIEGLVGLADADGDRLRRRVYNIRAMSPRADEFAASVRRVLPEVQLTFVVDPHRQAILDSWPRDLDDSAAREEWGFSPKYDLEAMTDHLIPEIRRMIELGLIPAVPDHS